MAAVCDQKHSSFDFVIPTVRPWIVASCFTSSNRISVVESVALCILSARTDMFKKPTVAFCFCVTLKYRESFLLSGSINVPVFSCVFVDELNLNLQCYVWISLLDFFVWSCDLDLLIPDNLVCCISCLPLLLYSKAKFGLYFSQFIQNQ